MREVNTDVREMLACVKKKKLFLFPFSPARQCKKVGIHVGIG